MDPLQLLRERIVDFPGYATDDDRRRADELVRAFLGEMLADHEAQMTSLAPGDAARLGALILRSAFTNQQAFGPYEAAVLDAPALAAMAAADARVVDLADLAATLDAEALPGYLTEVAAALDARDAEMRALATAPSATAG